MGDRGYIRVADDQAFSKARFRSMAPRSWASNALQLAGQRGHAVVAAHHLAVPIVGGSLVEIARFVFDSSPLETGLLCSATFGVPRAVGWPSLAIVWRIDTEDTAGAHTSSGDVWTYDYRPGFFDPFGQARDQEQGAGPRQCQWPLSAATTIEEHVHGWFVHYPDSALADEARVLKISAYAESDMGVTPDADDLILLRALTVIGYRAAE